MKKKPAVAPTAALVEARRQLMRFKRASVVRDNGYRRCVLCGAWTHMNQRLSHKNTCPMTPKEKKQ